MEHLIKETVQFKECTKVTLLNVKSEKFDIIEMEPLTNDGYCQALIDKIFSISHLEIPNFICYQLLYVKDKIHWLNKLEKLITLNSCLFKKSINRTKQIKLYASIENIRSTIVKPHYVTDNVKPPPRFINAESEERYFSFHKTQKEVGKLESLCSKIIFLTNEQFEYEQANIDFINPKLPDYASQCQKAIEHIQYLKKLTLELNQAETKNTDFYKLTFNGNINQLVDIFYQLNRELFVNGKPFIEANVNDIAKMIACSFVDKDGNNLSLDTIKTILTPSREEKRPNNAKRIDIDKLL